MAEKIQGEVVMILVETPYGEKCINRTDVKKSSRKICEKCPHVTWVGWTFSTCHLDTNKEERKVL